MATTPAPWEHRRWRNGICRAGLGGQTWYDIVIERSTEAQYKRFEWRYLFNRITVATNIPSEREAQDIVNQLKKDLQL